jgi:hypothetical protein
MITIYRLHDAEGNYIYGAEINGQYQAPEALWLDEIAVTEKVGEFESIKEMPEEIWKEMSPTLKEFIKKNTPSVEIRRIWDEEGNYIYGVCLNGKWYAPGENWLSYERYEEFVGFYYKLKDIPEEIWDNLQEELKVLIKERMSQ